MIKHLLFSPTIKARDYSDILNLFEEAVKKANRVICLDGLMSDWVVNYLKGICPEKQIVTVENTYKRDKALINWIVGVEQDERVKANDYSALVKMIVEDGSRFAVCSDSQMFLEGLDRLLQARGANGIRIDSKTTSEDHIKQFFKDPTEYLTDLQPDYVLYSPSAESGLDIPIKDYFNEHFALFFGVLDSDAILQMLGRIRDVEAEKYVWVKDRAIEQVIDTPTVRSSLVESFAFHANLSIQRDLDKVMSGEKDNAAIIKEVMEAMLQNQDVHSGLATQLQATCNHESYNLRDCVYKALEHAGHRVEVMEPLKAAKDSQKALKEGVGKCVMLSRRR